MSPATIARMCDAIRHRGPDDAGMHVTAQAALGMRRLSIIDLSGGHQPVFNEDRSCAIVYNGEIYNYRELRERLAGRGHTLTTHSDTETIVHLYEDHGPAAVELLRGMFGLAIWDERRRTLLLARDRFGIKPLYVVEAPWGLAFASELKALHAVGLTLGGLDPAAVETFLHLGYLPAPATPFRGVRKLEPGHWLTWRTDGTVTVQRYWDVPTHCQPAPPNVAERVREWLDDSVKAHLESDVPVAVFLSGGLDSSAVVAGMAQAGERPQAFTARYLGSGAKAADEVDLARQLADRYGAMLTVVDVEPRVRDLLEPIVRALDEPHADDSAIPSWLLSERVAASHKVALMGTGGDELFVGYRRHLGLGLVGAYGRVPRALRRAAARLARMLPEPPEGALGINRLKRFMESGEGGLGERYFDLIRRVTPATRDALLTDHVATEIRDVERARWGQLAQRGAGSGALRAALYLDYKTFLPDDILMLADRMSMAHSLETRVPFVDHVLVEHVFPLPDHVKARPWRGKRLLREALRPRLPESHFAAPKRGFVGPTAAWLRHELREVLRDELAVARIERLGWFRPAAVQVLLREHEERRQNHEAVLWALLCFSVWHRVYVEAPASAAYVPGAQD